MFIQVYVYSSVRRRGTPHIRRRARCTRVRGTRYVTKTSKGAFSGAETAMIRLWALAWLVLLTQSCATSSPSLGLGEEKGTLPRQLQARQVIVTLAPDTPERWALLSEELAREYGLPHVGAFPLTSLGVQCVVFQVTDDRPVD